MVLDFHNNRFNRRRWPNIVNGWDTLNFTEADLLHATYTVGRANRFQVVRHGLYSLYEMIYRTAMIRANLYENADSKLEKSPAYINLDPSEKGAVSYFIGMTILKLLCEFKLDVPFIMHLEVYEDIIERRVGRIRYRQGRSRPDFIAMNSDLDWFVFESKGRSNRLPDDLIDDAKEQAKMIRTIGGQRPLVKAANVTYFENRVLKSSWKDPKGDHEEVNIDMKDLNPIKFIRDYYKPYFELTNSTFRDNNRHEIILNLDMIGVTMKMPEILYEKLQEKNLTETGLSNLLKEVKQMKYETTELSKRGKDGIILELNETWRNRFKKKVEEE